MKDIILFYIGILIVSIIAALAPVSAHAHYTPKQMHDRETAMQWCDHQVNCCVEYSRIGPRSKSDAESLADYKKCVGE